MSGPEKYYFSWVLFGKNERADDNKSSLIKNLLF